MYTHNNCIKYFYYDLQLFYCTVNTHSHTHAHPSIDKKFVYCYTIPYILKKLSFEDFKTIFNTRLC